MAIAKSTPRIVELATQISKSVADLQAVLDAKGVPSPSFDENAPPKLPKEANDAQDAVLDATTELHDLLLEPVTLVLKNSANNSMGSLGFMCRFDIPNMVPLGGKLSYAEIAKKTGFAEFVVARFMRDCVCMRIFRESEPGVIEHTKTSKALRAPWFLAWLRAGAEEGWATMLGVVDALQKWPNASESDQTSFNIMHNTTGSYFENVANDPEKAARFGAGMATQWEFPGYQLEYLLDGYDWAALGPVKVIDVGGFKGRISIALADRFPNLNMLVQDMGMNEKEAHAAVPDELKDRVNFMAHDVFGTQTESADVYFIRQVLHDWPDKYGIKLLRSQIPKLKKGAKILLNESLLPETPGSSLPLWKERDLRTMDIGLLATMNGRERTLKEWKSIIAEADPRFVLQNVVQPKDSMLAVMEIVWNP
ncbi:Putative O-methyltransferase domain, S-adenosyl-L-methionine-dependent methyltransferase superfamily [Colletotrichum destructivum]|uniref:O-methyltransferase domain, S-adenosyl-L-methionine-dependent methyltransferase superfamily n=1 Tax=Colletotrichum destructivum TaxID=34406 RepID=A0AAX4IMR9_9PEZI|nr:Putative O-methyltransferase domain, S-adenosyl-L-methionine-dependent methyltransferase superfamily [Colletotrichum destructivum]